MLAAPCGCSGECLLRMRKQCATALQLLGGAQGDTLQQMQVWESTLNADREAARTGIFRYRNSTACRTRRPQRTLGTRGPRGRDTQVPKNGNLLR